MTFSPIPVGKGKKGTIAQLCMADQNKRNSKNDTNRQVFMLLHQRTDRKQNSNSNTYSKAGGIVILLLSTTRMPNSGMYKIC